MQVPVWQVSVCVQALPSLQTVPFGALLRTQTASTHASAVHGLLSLQLAALVQAKPTAKLRIASLPRMTSWAEIAPVPRNRSPVRNTFRATTMAVNTTSVPTLRELTAPSMVPLTISRSAPAFCVPFGTTSARSLIWTPVWTRTVEAALAASRPSGPTRRFWIS